MVETREIGAYGQGSLGAARAASHLGVLGDSSPWVFGQPVRLVSEVGSPDMSLSMRLVYFAVSLERSFHDGRALVVLVTPNFPLADLRSSASEDITSCATSRSGAPAPSSL